MRRSRIVIVAIALALIGAILPIAGMLYISQSFAVRAEQDRLALFADHTIARASLSMAEAREVFEREYLVAQISRFGGNISRTAEFVGMERSALHRKLKALGID